MTGLPLAVDRYGRVIDVPKGMAIMATPHDVRCDTGGCPQIEEISKPHGAATEVLLSLGKNPGPAATAMLTQSEISRSSGYTGDSCPDCGNFTMKRNGACMSCETCGGTTGCS